MKCFITCCLLVFCSYCIAQGNLQFSQAKLVTTVQTVPAGKVWKVESYAYNGGAAFAGTQSGFYSNDGTNERSYINALMTYSINGSSVQIPASLSRTGAVGIVPLTGLNLFPFWLPEGSTLAAGTNMSYLSVLEFNVVP
jgi:hypothetical protein